MAQRNLTRWIRRGLVAALLIGVLTLIVIAALPKPTAVDTSRATNGTLEVTVDEDGMTRVKDRHVISAPLTGSLERLELDPGDRVGEQQVVARIAPLAAPLLDDRTRAQAETRVASALAAQRQSRAGIDRAEAAARFAADQLSRQEALAGQGAAATTALEQARLEARSREAELTSARFAQRIANYEVEIAQAALGRVRGEPVAEGTEDQLEIGSPIEGIVLRVLRESEGVIATGEPLLELGDPAALEIVVDILTADAVNVAPGAEVRIENWGGEGALRGHVRRVEPSAFSEVSALGVREQRVNVIIDLDSERAEWEALGDGFRIEARIVIWREDSVLKIPSSALFRHEGDYHVFVVRDGTAVRTKVGVGRNNGIEAQILEGLSEGDEVIVHPSDRITDGSSVVAR
jgi:HlyD family secretion protein